MGKRNKRARTLLKKATMLGEEISPEVARRHGITNLLPQKTNSEKIEELKTTQPTTVVETPTTIEEPAFMTEAPKIIVEEPVVVAKVETKKKTTTKKRTPRKKTTTRARKTNTNTKSKSISSEK